jgi:SAM-dependent methyltransferase
MDTKELQDKIASTISGMQSADEWDSLTPADPTYMLNHPSPVGYNTIAEQNYLFQNVLSGFNPSIDSITDIGCGRADMCNFIQEFYGVPAPYYGIDHNPIMADLAKQKYGYDIFTGAFEKVLPTLSNTTWVVASGVFTQRRCDTEIADLQKLFADIDIMYESATSVVAFNLLSPINNTVHDGFLYVHPGLIMDMLIEKYRYVTVRNNYSNDVYTVLIYKI